MSQIPQGVNKVPERTHPACPPRMHPHTQMNLKVNLNAASCFHYLPSPSFFVCVFLWHKHRTQFCQTQKQADTQS